MNPHLLDFNSTSTPSTLQGRLSWNQPPLEQQYSNPHLISEGTQMEEHSDSRLHFTPEAEVTIGPRAMAEYEEACRNKKRKGKEVEKRNTCERKRRSRIADRMKTLQELLPNCSYKVRPSKRPARNPPVVGRVGKLPNITCLLTWWREVGRPNELLSAASVLDKTIEYIKTLQLQTAVLGYQQMMMDGQLIPAQNFLPRESAWDNLTDPILMTNYGGIIPAGIDQESTINPSTHPGLSYGSDGIFSSVTWSMPDSEFLLQKPMPGQLFDAFGGLPLASVAASQPVSLPLELVSSPLDKLL
ncbi:hypothetical protein F511_06369 [Dorcoceras hygrometricum]|uniref:BHLH domain-containing protein n=1 Tax=Dorcoceras hygrometricum TaxID=472368 RepID=A0A2Z7ACQ0_9LAMI|nr:hypothetical protein F511_06369 [Dorcoceras hygrometricum]